MASEKITAMPDLAGGQVPTDLLPAVDLSALPASQNKKTTLNDLFSVITKNITDGALRFQAVAAPASSTPGNGSIFFNSASSKFEISAAGSAYAAIVTAGDIKTSGLTQKADRILGRTSTGTGAIEELTAGANLSLSGGSLAVTGVALSGSVTTSGLTQNTARILGRTSASSGAIEEITIGSGLSLSAGSLSATGTAPAGTTGQYQINSGGAFAAGVITQGSTGRVSIVPTATTSGTGSYLSLVTPADTGITTATESVGAWWGGSTGSSVTRTWAGSGTVPVQRESVFTAPIYAAAGASSISTAATVAITGAPIDGTNLAVTNPLALWVQTGNSRVSLASGTASNPGFQLNSRDSGFYISGNNLGLSHLTIAAIGWSGFDGSTSLGAPYQLSWGSSGLSSPDISVQRHAAGVMRVGNAGVSAGQLLLGPNPYTGTLGQLTVLSAIANRNTIWAQSADASAFAPLVSVVVPSTTTAATTHTLSLRARSTGVPTAGFGGTLNFSAQTSLATDQEAAEIEWAWTDATQSSRTSKLTFSVVTGALAQDIFRIDSGGITVLNGGIRLTQSGGGTNYTGWVAPSALVATTPYTMPDNYPAVAGYMLASDTFGICSWIPMAAGGADILETQIFS